MWARLTERLGETQVYGFRQRHFRPGAGVQQRCARWTDDVQFAVHFLLYLRAITDTNSRSTGGGQHGTGIESEAPVVAADGGFAIGYADTQESCLAQFSFGKLRTDSGARGERIADLVGKRGIDVQGGQFGS